MKSWSTFTHSHFLHFSDCLFPSIKQRISYVQLILWSYIRLDKFTWLHFGSRINLWPKKLWPEVLSQLKVISSAEGSFTVWRVTWKSEYKFKSQPVVPEKKSDGTGLATDSLGGKKKNWKKGGRVILQLLEWGSWLNSWAFLLCSNPLLLLQREGKSKERYNFL